MTTLVLEREPIATAVEVTDEQLRIHLADGRAYFGTTRLVSPFWCTRRPLNESITNCLVMVQPSVGRI